MNNHYADIRSRIAEPPKWWDERAVPRYCDFGPGEGADIYACEVCLLEIGCQNCGQPFFVCMSWSWRPGRETSLRELIESNLIHYGDPPNAGCCGAGPTMNSVPRRVVEFWDRRDAAGEPARVPELEREIRCDWFEEADGGS